ncbi:MAG: twin-arginine translocase TatA/TatE family subunit [Candidatus Acidiferrales bacterium]
MLSVPHLIIIFAVALMVFGPEKLPELARNLGKIMGEFRRATGELRSTFEGHMRDLEREAELRRLREAQPPAQTIGAGSPSTPANPSTVPPESTSDPLPPAPGTVAAEPPNSFASRETQVPEQLPLDIHDNDSHQGDHPDSAREKVTDGRPRPA